MLNIQSYWRAVRELETTLPDEPWVMSLDDPARSLVGGRIVEVNREAAAKAILAKTHRLATKDEIEAHHNEDRRRAERLAADAREKAGICLLSLPAPKDQRRK